ncbi:uncharacterized protein [Clytia hemisphaerica]|uniref:Uncharacterized protein n=1 Tax=Clytia hemisphaerica TaxID=252671 RepID=A0A7M5VFF2_9CNID
MIKTIVWWTCGGAFAALYANKVQGLHFLYKPRRIVLVTLLGLAVGYKVHEFERDLPQLMVEARREHVFAPKSREMLLTYQAMVRRNQEQVTEGDFEVTEEEEEEDEDEE